MEHAEDQHRREKAQQELDDYHRAIDGYISWPITRPARWPAAKVKDDTTPPAGGAMTAAEASRPDSGPLAGGSLDNPTQEHPHA